MRKNVMLVIMVLIAFLAVSCETVLIDPHDTVDPDGLSLSLSTFDRLFDENTRKTLTIRVQESQWEALDRHMMEHYIRYGDYRDDTYVMADLFYSDDDGEDLVVGAVGLRTRGNLSRTRIVDDEGRPQMTHFKINFRETFNLNPSSETYDILSKRTVFDLVELDMKYNRNMDPTYLNERYALDLFSRAGVHAQETTLVDLYVEIGETRHHYGLYTVFEPVDERFIERRFDLSDQGGDLYKSLWQHYGPAALTWPVTDGAIGIKDASENYRPAYDLKTNKKTSTHADLIAFIHDLNTLEGDAFLDFLETRIDMTSLVRYFAAGVLLGNPDDYRSNANNYYLYIAPVTKRVTVIPYDYDHGLGQGWDGAPVFSDHTIGTDIHDWKKMTSHVFGQPDYPHPLVDRILGIPAYRTLYDEALAEMTDLDDGIFSFDSFKTMYDVQKGLYEDVLEDAMLSVPFGLRNIEDYITRKTDDVRNQLGL